MDTMWGQGEQSEEQRRRSEWLSEPIDGQQTTGTAKQTVLKTWTWLELEARKVLVEIASSIERSTIQRTEEEIREQKRLEDLENELCEQQQQPHLSEEQAVKVGDRQEPPSDTQTKRAGY